MDEVSVHVGGHVTLLFSIHSDAILPRNQGSKGAGLCLEHGVIVSVGLSQEDKFEIIDMFGNNSEISNELYSDLLEAFRHLFNISENISLRVELQLPLSQGFGMSAAGLLATSLALGELFDKGDEGQLARLAHRIERQHSSGLGDVLGLWAGGCALRTFPGCPPIPGEARSFSVASPALLIWDLNQSKHTSNYINDKIWKKNITLAGESIVSRLKKYNWNPSVWPRLLQQADQFAANSGLLQELERAELYSKVVDEMDENMSCHLCMLGTSIIVVPKDITSDIDFTELASKISELGYGTALTSIQ